MRDLTNKEFSKYYETLETNTYTDSIDVQDNNGCIASYNFNTAATIFESCIIIDRDEFTLSENQKHKVAELIDYEIKQNERGSEPFNNDDRINQLNLIYR